MRKQLLSPFVPFLMFFLYSSTTVAQTPSPAPSGPTNITAILEKAGQFTTLIRLMKSTQESDQINTQLNNSNQGLTVFAPPDNAFANLKAGALNSLSDQQKAGNSADGEFPLNVTTSGNQVNITTGVNTATVANTIFTDGQLVVYQVDQVLLPLDLFGTAAAPAPAPSKPDKDVPAKAPAGSKEDASADASGATIATVSVSLVLIAAISLKL
ncbi:fasciclin-like AGP 13 [Populus alba x Populus x berolinensis]|nr:fasciclin-like AGP 13 [Populus alba x Populus x berolinensis]